MMRTVTLTIAWTIKFGVISADWTIVRVPGTNRKYKTIPFWLLDKFAWSTHVLGIRPGPMDMPFGFDLTRFFLDCGKFDYRLMVSSDLLANQGSTYLSMGIRKAAVLPEPVWAHDIISLPAWIIGTAHFWTGVGTV